MTGFRYNKLLCNIWWSWWHRCSRIQCITFTLWNCGQQILSKSTSWSSTRSFSQYRRKIYWKVQKTSESPPSINIEKLFFNTELESKLSILLFTEIDIRYNSFMCSLSSNRTITCCWLGRRFKSSIGFTESCTANSQSTQTRLRGMCMHRSNWQNGWYID